MKLTYKRTCKVCGNQFNSTSSRKFLCSKECNQKFRSLFTYEKVCQQCGKNFSTNYAKTSFCSDDCRREFDNAVHRAKRAALPTKYKTCAVCGKEFVANGSAKTCSPECSKINSGYNLVQWRFNHACNVAKRTTPKHNCIMCGEPCPPRHYLFCSDECELMHRQTEYMYKRAGNKTIFQSICKVCHNPFWTTSTQRQVCSTLCENKRGDNGSFNDRVKRSAQYQKDLERYRIDTPLSKCHGHDVSMVFADTIHVKRLTPNVCLCLRCNKEFVVSKSRGAALQILKARSIVHKSPCPWCGEQRVGVRGKSLTEDFIRTLYPSFTERHYKPDWMNGLEIDMYDPSKKIGIEFNGDVWHSTKYNQDHNRHKVKADLADKNGVLLIQIMESEWKFKKNIITSMLDELVGNQHATVAANNLIAKELSSESDVALIKTFMNTNHINGYAKHNWAVGLFNGNEIMCICTFKRDADRWSIVQYCCKLNMAVTDGLNACINVFSIKHPDVTMLQTIVDRRWYGTLNNVFFDAGFYLKDLIKPKFVYSDLCINHPVKSPSYMTKNAIKNRAKIAGSKESAVFSNSKSGESMANELGYYRIYDAGYSLYEINLAA